ncbi:MAG TPA: MFS transporter [Candidatus Lokiarchaeia archaeon]|nr:MFS transporter [Candidatus Lokiarchaeia archaeon]
MAEPDLDNENKTENEKEKERVEGRSQTQVVINTANIIDNADGQLFPSVYPQVQATMGLSIEQLGFITGVRSILQSVTTPIWGWYNDTHSRKKVLAFGCFFWGVFTILMAFAVQYYDMLFYRAITGIGLAVIIPTSQSIIADYFPPQKRGKAFGWLGLTQLLGVIIGTLFATAIVSETDFILGIDSWRFIFIVWGLISIVIAGLVIVFAKDPARGQMDAGKDAKAAETHKPTWADYKEILTNRTFVLIVAQGVAGSIPWNALLFLTAWFEYIGFTPIVAGLAFALVAIGSAFGNLLGGWIGDKAAKWNPQKGRILIAQISVFTGIPLMAVIFFAIPMSTDSFIAYVLVGFLTGILISWSGPGCTNPLFSEIFLPEIRGSVYSVDRLFEGSFQALGTIFVSMVAVAYGFQTPVGTIAQQTAAFNATNALALAWGMFWITTVPWSICLILFTLVYFTYPKDCQRIRTLLQERERQTRTQAE